MVQKWSQKVLAVLLLGHFWDFGQKGQSKGPFWSRFVPFGTKIPFRGQNGVFGLCFCPFLAVCDTRWQIAEVTSQPRDFFSTKHLPRQIFSKLAFEIFAKTAFDDKTANFRQIRPKICDARVPDYRISFWARDFTSPAQRAKSTEKFRASPPVWPEARSG